MTSQLGVLGAATGYSWVVLPHGKVPHTCGSTILPAYVGPWSNVGVTLCEVRGRTVTSTELPASRDRHTTNKYTKS